MAQVRTPKQAETCPVDKVFLSNKETMKYLGVSDGTLKNWRLSGMIKFYKIGSLIWYTKEDIDKLIKSHRQ